MNHPAVCTRSTPLRFGIEISIIEHSCDMVLWDADYSLGIQYDTRMTAIIKTMRYDVTNFGCS